MSTPAIVVPVKKIEGKYVSLEVLSHKADGRKFLRGTVTCPYTGKQFKFDIVAQLDQVKPGVVQYDGGFLEHARKVQQYAEWFYERIEPYSRNSFHRRKYFVCRKCDFKTTRYVDILLHLMQIHGFLVKVP